MSTIESGAPLAQVSSRISHNEKHDLESPLDEKQDPALAYTDSRTSIPALRDDGQLAIVNDGSPFPVDPSAPVETQQFTVRAVLIGSLLGLIVGASNIYLGLKTGFTFGAGLFGAIFGFAIIKPLSHVLPAAFGGGYFGPKENAVVQTAATSAGSLTGLFVAAVPAMYHLKLMTTPKEDIGRLFTLTIITAFYGLFFAIPLRKYYILKQRLVFPSPTATAFTIRSLHDTTTPAARIAAKKKIKILAISFSSSLVFKTVSGYAPGILWDWHIFWWLYTWGWKGIIHAESWGWFIELTPAFFGAGMLSGLNASWSFMLGSVLAWGVIGPTLVKQGKAFGAPKNPDIPGWIGYTGMSSKDYINRPSPRYWLLWPGVFLMVCYSFAEVAYSAPIFWKAMKSAYTDTSYKLRERKARKNGVEFTEPKPEGYDMMDDPAPKEEQVPLWAWVIGLTLSAIGTLVVGHFQFHLNAGVGIVSLLLAFIFAFIGVQSSGTTDVNPVGVIAKASQLVIGGITKGQGIPLHEAQLANLVAGSVAGQAASHAVDMTGDLKTGHLLRASPKAMFWAQVVGSGIGIWLSVGLFVLFATAYPCLTDLEAECTAFGMPAVAAWRSVTIAVTSPTLPIPKSSGMTAIGMGIAAAATVVIKYQFVPEKYHKYIPNWNGIGLGLVVPQTYYPIAMIVGAHVAHTWTKRRPASAEIWIFALAAGLIAGEGMGGVLSALLTIVKVDGGVYGSAVACPGFEYCG
ncbi:OPT superfamily oligopeptide transporter [Ceratobasidium sp. AG-I]|nr:OPT superfamily oligopeptide transporter [Ceratobasidium sp. AG-I]